MIIHPITVYDISYHSISYISPQFMMYLTIVFEHGNNKPCISSFSRNDVHEKTDLADEVTGGITCSCPY